MTRQCDLHQNKCEFQVRLSAFQANYNPSLTIILEVTYLRYTLILKLHNVL